MPLRALVDVLVDAITERMTSRAGAVQPRLLTVRQAAAFLGRTEKAIYNLVAVGTLPSVRADGRVMRDRIDLDKWIEANKDRAGV